MPGSVLMRHDIMCSLCQIIQGPMQAIGDGQLLKMQPEAFDHIQERTVFGQPVDMNPILKQTQGSLHCFAAVVGGIIHHKNEGLIRIICRQLFQKFNKTVTVLVPIECVADPGCAPVVCPESVQTFGRARCRHELACAPFHPATAQRRMQTYRRFVHKEEFECGNRMIR